ncbi:MAG: tetratricopeptide repeat protein [Patescibacteria group bacterium]|jgi:tetratricopeptide (TPR) repeat protein
MSLFFHILDIAGYVIAGLAFIGIFVILLRKFSVVASIDTQSIPKHQQEEVRQKLAAKRLLRKFERAGGFMKRFVKPPLSKSFAWVKDLIQQLIKLERQISVKIAKKHSKQDDTHEKITELKEIAEKAHDSEDYNEAEQKYIEMISLNPHSVEAYKKLGDLYMQTKEYKSALEAYTYIISLEKKQGASQTIDAVSGSTIANHYIDITYANIGLEHWSDALISIDEALKFDPNNPKYLDVLFSVTIELKDVKRADEALTRLKEVNPENQKLEEFTDELARIER